MLVGAFGGVKFGPTVAQPVMRHAPAGSGAKWIDTRVSSAADPKSGAGIAYGALAQHYLSLAGGDEIAADATYSGGAADGAPARRRRLLRRGN